MALLSVEAAQALVLDGAEPLGAEAVPLAAASGRVLAETLTARLTQPPFDASAMDGYAVRSADVITSPACLTVVGESVAGRRAGASVSEGEAVRILTGAPIPAGADTVVIQENVARAGAKIVVHASPPVQGYIRRRGSDFMKGDVLLKEGRRLDARALTLAAAGGHASLPVRRRPHVALISTGSELVAPGTEPGPDQIIASNAVGLAAMIEAAGGRPTDLGIAADDPLPIAQKIALAQGSDVLVTIGGASVGDRDLAVPVLERQGMTLLFHKVAVRPGKPSFFGRLGPMRVIGVPGNPVSALITAWLFLVPLIHRLLGRGPAGDQMRTAVLSHSIEANGDRAFYMRATLKEVDGGLRVSALPEQDSASLTALARADCLIIRPPNAPTAEAGSFVPVLQIDF